MMFLVWSGLRSGAVVAVVCCLLCFRFCFVSFFVFCSSLLSSACFGITSKQGKKSKDQTREEAKSIVGEEVTDDSYVSA